MAIQINTDFIQLNSKPFAFLIVRGRYVRGLQMGDYSSNIQVYKTRALARTRLQRFAHAERYQNLIDSDTYHDDKDGYIKIVAIQQDYIPPKPRDKHPLSTKIVRG